MSAHPKEFVQQAAAQPIGVAGWESQLQASLPEKLKGSLPTIKELEAELNARSDSAERSEP